MDLNWVDVEISIQMLMKRENVAFLIKISIFSFFFLSILSNHWKYFSLTHNTISDVTQFIYLFN